MTSSPDPRTLLSDLLDKAKAAGADAADAVFFEATSLSHAQRLGKLERLEREESLDLGLRVFLGRKQAIVSSTDLDDSTLDNLVERALAMARNVPEDPYCGLAPADDLATEFPELDIHDPREPTPEELIERARACEDAARAVSGVTNSEGAEASWGRAAITLATSNGFCAGYTRSSHSLSTSVLAGNGRDMERDYEFSSVVHGEDLDDPVEIGRKAGEKAVRRLGASKPTTGQVPVVFDTRVSNGLIGHLAGAIVGPAIARGTSFLKDSLDQVILPDAISVIDDPHLRRGLRSKPFDGEGVANRQRKIIDQGRLTTWLLDLSSARQLGLQSTGHAARGTSGPPSPSTTNLFMEPGAVSPEALLADIDSGLYITEMMGMGVNGVTGDYSRGAAGFWIDKGELAQPISEATVAGNLKDMFREITAADDLRFRYGSNAPTLRIDGMMVAGA